MFPLNALSSAVFWRIATFAKARSALRVCLRSSKLTGTGRAALSGRAPTAASGAAQESHAGQRKAKFSDTELQAIATPLRPVVRAAGGKGTRFFRTDVAKQSTTPHPHFQKLDRACLLAWGPRSRESCRSAESMQSKSQQTRAATPVSFQISVK